MEKRSNNLFHPDDWIVVRGIPISRAEVFLKQEQLGAQLFDESLFAEMRKKQAAANVIRALDFALKRKLDSQGLTEIPEGAVMVVDIGDPSWKYIPIKLVGPKSQIKVVASKEKPAGPVAWFRIKKQY